MATMSADIVAVVSMLHSRCWDGGYSRAQLPVVYQLYRKLSRKDTHCASLQKSTVFQHSTFFLLLLLTFQDLEFEILNVVCRKKIKRYIGRCSKPSLCLNPPRD